MRTQHLIRNSKWLLILPLVWLFSFRPVMSENKRVPVQTIRTVVIDAGHGGKDPGCHGASAHEKNVCLAMALSLGAKIKEAFPEIKIVYTRDKDVFVELDERAHIANRANADLFICIHANSASPSAYGTETYVLGLHRTEAQSKIADRENKAIDFEDDAGEKYKDFDMSPDAIIARQLQLSVFLDQSILFAGKLQSEFKSIGRYDRGVKQAGFIVLYKTTMPAVLIETGFLTNAEEEKFLAEPDNHNKMAGAMFAAFEKYKAELEGLDVPGSRPKTAVQEIRTNESGKKPETVPANGEGKASGPVVFRVQIETSEAKVAGSAARFRGLEVFEYQQDKLFKYCVGTFENDFNAANRYKGELRENGFSNAFVVAFQNGERISLEKAIKLAKK